jgi:enoyl-CoA hydratase
MSERVRYSCADGIATIALDDGKVNVMSLPMQAEIHAALDRAERDGAVIVMRGRPTVFSAGFDLGTLKAGGLEGIAMVRGGFELSARILEIPAPVVMVCTGHAIAMGAFLLLSGDYLLGATGDYRLTANEVAIGLTVPLAATEILRHRLTPAAFERAVITAEVFGPHNAIETGFLDSVVEPGAIDATAAAIAARLAGLDRVSHVATKRRCRAGALAALRTAIRDEFETA